MDSLPPRNKTKRYSFTCRI